MQEELKGRKHFILLGVVEDYIKDASPITSSGVKDRHLKDISTATLRNELNALEAMGYLKQLHTSGGRIPTTLGYQYYVNHLLKNANLTITKLDGVREILNERTNSLSEIVSGVAKLVNKAVKYPTVVFVNGYEHLVIENIKVIPLVSDSALALIQTSSGYLTNSINAKADERACSDASSYLTRKFGGKTIADLVDGIDELESSLQKEISGFKFIALSLIEGMRKLVSKKMLDIKRDGSLKLLEEAKGDESKKVLSLLEDEKELERALESSDDLSITLVEENEYEGCALVKAPIVIDGAQVASIGVVGPQRMDYASIASALKFVMNEMGKEDK